MIYMRCAGDTAWLPGEGQRLLAAAMLQQPTRKPRGLCDHMPGSQSPATSLN